MLYPTEMAKKRDECEVIDTNHLIVLCEIGEEYKSFCQDLEKLIKSRRERNLVTKVYHAMKTKRSLKYKSFIEKHKTAIELMTKYSCLSNLTVLSYDAKGKRRKNLPEDYFYQYLQEHKDDIERIKALVAKIKSLEIEEIAFSEKLDFTDITFEYRSSCISKFALLENMRVNSTYLDDPIQYRTDGSYYCILFNISTSFYYRKTTLYDRNIVLNSLVIDPDRLPNEITLESTIDIIKNLAKEKKPEQKDMIDSVNLSISISDLKEYFKYLKAVYENIYRLKDHQEFNEIMLQLESTIAKIEESGEDFEQEVIDSYKDITKDMMEKEKKLYLERRREEEEDIDDCYF